MKLLEVFMMKKFTCKFNLEAQFDSAKSFYGKARVKEESTEKNFFTVLTSYNKEVAAADYSKKMIYLPSSWDETKTTLRHVREYIRQIIGYNIELNTKKLRCAEGKAEPYSIGSGWSIEFIGDGGNHILPPEE